MTFTAKVRRNSRIWPAWQLRHAASGTINGVVFRWVAGGDYVSGSLADADVMRLQGADCVQLEVFGPVADVGDSLVPVENSESVRSRSIAHTPGWRRRLREIQASG